jgi:hypothetical protein
VAGGSEVGTWSAVRDPDTAHPYGLATFDVDPGRAPGDRTTMTVNFYHTEAATTANPFPPPVLFDSFALAKSRRDGLRPVRPAREKIPAGR